MNARVERLLFDKDFTYDEFRSELAHYIKYSSVHDFITTVFKDHPIEILWEQKRYAESLYILALFDYIMFKCDIDSSRYFEQYRKLSLKNILFPKEIIFLDKLNNSTKREDEMLTLCKSNECSRFFLRHNIAEIMEDVYGI